MIEPLITITLDYELPGDGSGDVFQNIILPTRKLLNILNKRNIKMTVFFEIEEYLCMKKNSYYLNKQFGYNPSLLIENQINEMIDTGHEIGLHIHPQWINSKFYYNNFIISEEKLCLSDHFSQIYDLTFFLKSRIEILENLVQKYNKRLKIISYRAGGHCIKNRNLVFNSLYRSGIKVDSSIVKGMNNEYFDYRDCPQNIGYWEINHKNYLAKKDSTMFEFPIYSKTQYKFRKLKFNRVKNKFFLYNKSLNKKSNNYSYFKSFFNIFNLLSLLKKEPIKFDFCHMNTKEMLSFFNSAFFDSSIKNKYPLTIIGHSKEFYNDYHFQNFLDYILKTQRAEFNTISQTLSKI